MSDARTGSEASTGSEARTGSDAITRDEVAHIAKLSMLTLTDDELDTFTGQLAAVLDHVRDVEALDLDAIEPTHHPFGLRNVSRPDVVVPSLDRAEVLGQAPAVEAERFKVPPALGTEPMSTELKNTES